MAASVQIAAAFPASIALRKRGSAVSGRKPTLRAVSCQLRSENDQEAVDILQSSRNPLLNLPREDLMAALGDGGFAAPAAAESAGPRRRSTERVVFTVEKARLLRKENRASQTFHDKWYHSAIASKLAMPE